MTADFYRFDMDFLGQVDPYHQRGEGGNLVVYDVTSKPPGTMSGSDLGYHYLRNRKLRHHEEGARLAGRHSVDYAFHDYSRRASSAITLSGGRIKSAGRLCSIAPGRHQKATRQRQNRPLRDESHRADAQQPSMIGISVCSMPAAAECWSLQTGTVYGYAGLKRPLDPARFPCHMRPMNRPVVTSNSIALTPLAVEVDRRRVRDYFASGRPQDHADRETVAVWRRNRSCRTGESQA